MNTNKSSSDITIKFNYDNKSTNIKAIFFVGIVTLTILLSMIYKNWIVFVVGLFIIALVKKIIEQPDGLLKLRSSNEKLYLSKIIKKKEVFSSEVISSEFSWNYVHTKTSSGNNDADGKTGHTNHNQLKLEFQLKEGIRMVLHEELFPWKSIPKGWNYKVFNKKIQDEILHINGDLKKIKEDFEKEMIKT